MRISSFFPATAGDPPGSRLRITPTAKLWLKQPQEEIHARPDAGARRSATVRSPCQSAAVGVEAEAIGFGVESGNEVGAGLYPPEILERKHQELKPVAVESAVNLAYGVGA